LIKINTIGGDPADQYMKKKKEDTFSERGGRGGVLLLILCQVQPVKVKVKKNFQ